MADKRKKIGILLLLVLSFFALAIALLINNANRILKHEIEKAMGKNLSVRSISLNWGSVDAYGLRLMKENEVFAEAGKVSIQADFLGLLKKEYSLSRLVIEKPVVRLKMNKEGEIVNPLTPQGEKRETASPGVPAFEVKSIVIEKGFIQLEDERLPPGENIVEVRDLDLQFDNLQFPLRDSSSAIKISAAVKSGIASGSIECEGRVNLKTHAFNLDADAGNLSISQRNSKEPAASAEKIALHVVSEGGASNRVVISEIAFTRPYLMVEVDKKGKVIGLAPVRPEVGAGPQKKESAEIVLKKIIVTGGRLVYLDGKVSSPPYPTRVDSIEANMTDISLPFGNNWTGYSFSARIPGRGSSGSVKWAGKTNFKTLDTDSNIVMRSLDITGFKPYFQKKTDADVTRGTLDISMTLGIRSKMINAPGKATLRNLEFRTGKGVGDKFIGVPRSMVLNLLETGNKEIPIDFILKGRLDDPKFNITEGLTKRFTVGLANKLGLSVVEAGETVIVQGGKGVKEVGKGIKGIGESLQNIFKK